MNRRAWLFASAGGAAAVAGAGWSWLQLQPGATAPGALDALWALELDKPVGGLLNLASLLGKPLVLNFWATWCPPCVEELPLLDAFYQENALKGWQVLGIAVDNAKAVNQFLAKTPLRFPNVLAGLAGTELSRSLGNLTGGLPFTVVISSSGQIAARHMGKLSASQIRAFLTVT